MTARASESSLNPSPHQVRASQQNSELIQLFEPWLDAETFADILADVAELGDSTEEEIERYARLLAAAPELLEALQFVKQFFDKLEGGLPADDPVSAIRRKFHAPVHAKIDSAIAKALGQ